MSFGHLSITERNELYKLRVIEQLSMTEIGRQLKRNKSTISRELSRNIAQREMGYLPDTAVVLMQARRKQAKVRFQLLLQHPTAIAIIQSRINGIPNQLR